MIWTHPENRGVRGRRLLGWVGWQAWQRTVARPRVVHLHGGVRLLCHPHDHVTSLALYCGLYDSEEMRFLLAWLRPGDTFLDVGANVAPYSLLSTLVDDVAAVAFEPGALARERAAANIRLNHAEQRATLVPCAVSDQDGIGRLTSDRWATNTLVDDGYDGDVEQVEMVSLDSYTSAGGDRSSARCEGGAGGRISLVKIDVEGHEPDVLRGAEATIARHRPAMIIENNDVEALRRWADEHSYTLVAYDPTTGRLDGGAWPSHRGGNLILVPDFDEARRRVAPTAGRGLIRDEGR